MRRELVLASANPEKVREILSLVQELGYILRTLSDFKGLTLPPEEESSYAANALAKGRAVTQATGLPVLADDSGLEVDALGGAPGVRSARYGGPGLSDRERVTRLLEAIEGVPDELRSARFRCVLALTTPWGEEAVVEGLAEGLLTRFPRGAAGFGYDPIFWVPEMGRTFAELSLSEKARVSHRARALAAARPFLERWLSCRGGSSSVSS